MILAEIKVGDDWYYCAETDFEGSNYYWPFLLDMSTLEIGPMGNGGLIGVRIGNLTLTRDPHNINHPFGGERYQHLVNNDNQYLCKLIWSKTWQTIHEGAISLTDTNEQNITFALTPPTYDQELKRFSITEKWNYVEDVKAGSGVGGRPLTITTSLNHEYVVGMRVVFAEMTGAGKELNYSKADNNWFIVGSVSGQDIGLYNKDNEPLDTGGFTLGTPVFDNGDADHSNDGIPKNRIGVPALIPFTHGTVFHKTPVIRRSNTEVANPNMMTSNPAAPLEVYEDGVLILSTDSSSPEYAKKFPTDDVIYLNSGMGQGQLSICGRSRNGGTLTELFQYFATQLTLGLNTDKA